MEITIWIKPHHDFGFIKTLWVFEEDDKYSFILREQRDQARSENLGKNEIDESSPFKEKNILNVCPSKVLEMLDGVKPSLLEEYEYRKLGGAFFGLRIERGYLKTTFEWHGDMDTFDPCVVRLYEYVYNL